MREMRTDADGSSGSSAYARARVYEIYGERVRIRPQCRRRRWLMETPRHAPGRGYLFETLIIFSRRL